MFYKENKSRYSCSDSYLLKVFLIPSTAPLTTSLTFSNTSLAFAKFFSTVPSVSVLCSPVTLPNNSFAAADAYRTYSCNLSNKLLFSLFFYFFKFHFIANRIMIGIDVFFCWNLLQCQCQDISVN